LRDKKREEKELRDKLREQFVFENPSAAKERVDAGVFRMVYEHHVKEAKPQSEELLLNLTFKPNLSRTLKNVITVKYHHTGKWIQIPQGKKQVDAWSCCGDTNKESEVNSWKVY
jgi:hypothetical protein